MDETIWEFMKGRWDIKKSRIKEIGVDPNKKANDVTWLELSWLADELDVTVGELIEY